MNTILTPSAAPALLDKQVSSTATPDPTDPAVILPATPAAPIVLSGPVPSNGYGATAPLTTAERIAASRAAARASAASSLADPSLFRDRTPEERRAHLFKPSPAPASPADPTVAAELASLEQAFAPTLAPEALPAIPSKAVSPPASFLNAHNAIIDQLLIDPGITTKTLALKTGYTRGWLSRVLQSDAFQAKLAERTKALVDPIVMQKIEDRLKGMTSMALEILEEKLELTQSADLALSVLAVTTKSLGLGQKQQGVVVQNSFVVHVPAKAESAESWAAAHGGEVVAAEEVRLIGEGGEAEEEAAARGGEGATGFGATDGLGTLLEEAAEQIASSPTTAEVRESAALASLTLSRGPIRL